MRHSLVVGLCLTVLTLASLGRAQTPVSTAAQLVSAVQAANATPGPEVIILAPGTYALASELVVTDELEVRAPGEARGCDFLPLVPQNPALGLSEGLGGSLCDGDAGEDAAQTVLLGAQDPNISIDQRRVFRVENGAKLTLRHLTVTGGDLGIAPPERNGAGILVASGRLELFNVTVENNRSGGSGGGIAVFGASTNYPLEPNLVIVNSRIRNNFTNTAIIRGSTGALGAAGGIYLVHPQSVAFVIRSTLNGNGAIRGGAIQSAGILHVYNSTLSGNVAGQTAGAILMNATDSFLELRWSTVTNNYAHTILDSVEPNGAAISLRGVAKAEMYGNIVANNRDCSQGSIGSDCRADAGTFVSAGSNFGSTSCGFTNTHFIFGNAEMWDVEIPAVTDMTLAASDRPCNDHGFNVMSPQAGIFPAVAALAAQRDMALRQSPALTPFPLLGRLSDNGGPTPTHALEPGASAVLAGRAPPSFGEIFDPYPSAQVACPPRDQRGLLVGFGINNFCDAGAFQSDETRQSERDRLAQNLASIFPDTDGDGIADVVDEEPLASSTLFGDFESGGITAGTVLTRGAQTLRLFDAFPNPTSGVTIISLPNGGTTPARISACDDLFQVELGPDDLQTITCPPSPTASSADIRVNTGLVLHDRATLRSDAAVGGNTVLGFDVKIDGNVAAGGTVSLAERVGIDGNLTAAGTISGSTSGVSGTVQSNTFVAAPASEIRSVVSGVGTVSVPDSGVLAIEPGVYGTVTAGYGATLVLAPGRHVFGSLELRHDARLQILGSVQIEVEGDAAIGDRVRFLDELGSDLTSAAAILIYTTADTVTFGYDSVFAGSLEAPLASVALLDRSVFRGSLAANSLEVGFDVRQYPADADPCDDGVKNGDEQGVDCGGSCATSCACGRTTHEAESMFHSTGAPFPAGWNVWTNGYISTNQVFQDGTNSVTVTASGSVANGVGPHMVVRVGGVAVGDTSVATSSWQDYTFRFVTGGGNKEVRVEFDNDFYAPPVDRNLFVDKIIAGCDSADLVAHYKFDEASGSTAFDSSGNGRNATLVNGASFVAGFAGNAVGINGGTQRVNLPSAIVQSCTDLTIALRAKLTTNSSNWTRLFDFGSSTATNMFLTPRAGASNVLRFGFKVNGGVEQQISFTTTFPTNVWKHVAVTLAGNTGKLYLDGVQVAQNTSLTNNPNQMGATVNNWLGHSQYSADPQLSGALDDLRISCRPYAAAEIAGLAAQ